jgi:hypothetical protein
LSQRAAKKIVNTGIVLGAKLPSIPKAATLAVILRDEASGTVGSVHVPLNGMSPATH